MCSISLRRGLIAGLSCPTPRRARALVIAVGLLAIGAARGDDEALIFTPPGFDRPGPTATAPAEGTARLEIVVLDGERGGPTPCRVNVVGADGRFYQPAENRLSPFSLTGEWPKTGKGNRTGKAPFRYLGRFFYTTGRVTVAVPAGGVRVEIWKGLEYRPQSLSTRVAAGETRRVTVALERAVDMAALGYESGDTHLHFPRTSDDDDEVVFDLMEAEDLKFGALLGYNEPAGPYTGVREKLDSPQLRGLGVKSERRRGNYRIVSGQEYRSTTYGHLNIFLRDDLVREGENLNANNWPVYGLVGRETRRLGGYTFHAHGGYAQEIYADFVRGDVQAVELLQFGIYRGIELDDWYRILNAGFRFPCVGASDYPACRKLADCVTYVKRDRAAGDGTGLDSAGWFRGASGGESFVTTGPMLLLEVDGRGPGALIEKAGGGTHRVNARVRALSMVAPVTSLQLVVNGKVVEELTVPASQGVGNWVELGRVVELSASSWLAARASGKSATGTPDAEAHTNPVYIHLDGKAPYDRESLDRLVEKLDAQMNLHRARTFPEKAKALDYFQASRDILLKVREAGGLPSGGVPAAWMGDENRAGFDPTARAHTDAELAAFLEPLPPKTPAEALKTFETTGGFRMEVLAAEPLVRSPVAAAYDEDGNLYVAEMTDYPYKPRPGNKPLGSVRLLRDTDGDGRFDESHVFADGLLWAAGVAPWKGGVFVASPPDIWYLKDTDGDRRADVRCKVFTGFGTENEQAMLNNLVMGLDHKIYGSTAGNGGTVRPAGDPGAPGVSVKGKDFRFDPVTEAFEPITGTVQFGNTFDDFGDRFLCSESRPMLHAVLPLEALARNPYLPVASAIENVAGSPVPIFRISPLERWRQIRSSRRIAHGERSAGSAGASHHVVDAAAGVTIFRGHAYPGDYYGNGFVCDAQNNLIHRMRLTPDGPTFRAERADPKAEFVRSYDTWFRPVNLVNAPDGTLHVLDMSREVIEAIHIPLDVVKHLDLRRGRDQGRVYRVAPPGFVQPPPPRLGSADTPKLVATLDSPNGWSRDTAHRLIFERQDPSAVGPLRDLLARGSFPVARVLALWSLQGLNALTDADLLAASADPSPRVVEQAVRLAEPRLGSSPALFDRVAALSGSDDARVRFAVALALGAARDPRAADALAAVARRDASDRWTRLAVLASSAETADRLLAALAGDRSFAGRSEGASFLGQLAGVVGARNRPEEVGRVLNAAADGADPRLSRRLVLGLARGLRQSGGRLDPDAPTVAGLLRRADAEARDGSAPESVRLEAVALLGCVPPARARDTLAGLLDPVSSGPVQVAVVRALAGSADPEVSGLLLGRARQLAPAARAEAVATLLSREPWTLALLRAVKSGDADPAPIDPARRSLLISHKNPEIASLARTLFSATGPTPAQDALAAFAPALKQAGDPTRGSQVFDRLCSTCHRLGDRGHAVGPDLTATQFRDPEALLTHTLDPNRYVAPGDVQYVVSDKSGRVYTGLIASETASSLTLRRAEGAEDTILRSQIDELSSTGRSLMPDDLGSKLTHQEAADLISFLLKARSDRPDGERLDIGTLPGLIEPDEKK
jgi:putative membrane-bound dehydrogenase-like protein